MTREEAIEYLEKLFMIADITDEYGDMADTEPYETAINMAVEALSSAEPERKTGKWIGYKADDKEWQRNDGSPIFLVCDQCKNQVINNGSATWNFCPSCGSYNIGRNRNDME